MSEPDTKSIKHKHTLSPQRRLMGGELKKHLLHDKIPNYEL